MEYQGPKIKSGDKKRVRVSRCVVHPSKKRGMDKNEIWKFSFVHSVFE